MRSSSCCRAACQSRRSFVSFISSRQLTYVCHRPASFLPRSFIPGYLSLPLTPSVEDDWLLNRPPTRTSRSHTISDPPGLQAPSRPSLNRGRSESTSTVRDGDDLGSDCALATLGRTRTAETSARRPSLPTALLSPRLPTPVFGLESKTSLRTRLGSSEDDDDWLKDERHYAEQRATFAAKISPRLPNSSINMDARIPLSASRPVAKTTPVDQTTTTGMSLCASRLDLLPLTPYRVSLAVGRRSSEVEGVEHQTLDARRGLLYMSSWKRTL